MAKDQKLPTEPEKPGIEQISKDAKISGKTFMDIVIQEISTHYWKQNTLNRVEVYKNL